MIDGREILAIATTLGLLPNIVEKDYVLSWVLAGIFQHAALAETWVFKGGTCLKKCYFETYRFSADLDFTLTDESQFDNRFSDTYFPGDRRLGLRADWHRITR
jgi:predicted nucleotidyltransferase component of viral defense system